MAQEALRLRWLQTDHATYVESQRRVDQFWLEHLPSMDLTPSLASFASVDGPMPLLHDAWVTRLELTDDGLLQSIELFTVAQGSKCSRLSVTFEGVTETLGLGTRNADALLHDPECEIVGYELDHAGDGGFELRCEAADRARFSVCFADVAWATVELPLAEYMGEAERRRAARPRVDRVIDELSWHAGRVWRPFSRALSVGRRRIGATSHPKPQLMRWRYADQDEDDEATDARWAAYSEHLAQTRSRFPATLQELTDGGPLDVSELLHDAVVVDLELDGDDTWTLTALCPNSRGQGEYELRLTFTGSELLGPSRAEMEPYLTQPGAGLDYSEVDVADDGERFELRVISWADLPQFGFRFRDVSYHLRPLVPGADRAEHRRRAKRS